MPTLGLGLGAAVGNLPRVLPVCGNGVQTLGPVSAMSSYALDRALGTYFLNTCDTSIAKNQKFACSRPAPPLADPAEPHQIPQPNHGVKPQTFFLSHTFETMEYDFHGVGT